MAAALSAATALAAATVAAEDPLIFERAAAIALNGLPPSLLPAAPVALTSLGTSPPHTLGPATIPVLRWSSRRHNSELMSASPAEPAAAAS